MDCDELNELLSAYADGELARTQVDFIEGHLALCPQCRATLAAYRLVSQQIASLRATPPVSGLEKPWVPEREPARIPEIPWRWRRLAFVITPVTVALAVLLSLYVTGFFQSSSGIIARAYAATEQVQSFRAVTTSETKWSGMSTWVAVGVNEFEYAGPQIYRLKFSSAEGYYPQSSLEIIVINGRIYLREIPELPTLSQSAVNWIGNANQGISESSVPSMENTLLYMSSLVNVERFPDATIDGTRCLHYSGNIEMEKYISETITMVESRPYPPSDETLKKLADGLRAREIKVELWVGKEDYVLRQVKETSQPRQDLPNAGGSIVVGTTKYSGFNEPIIIEPPLDAEGNLLSGWYLTMSDARSP